MAEIVTQKFHSINVNGPSERKVNHIAGHLKRIIESQTILKQLSEWHGTVLLLYISAQVNSFFFNLTPELQYRNDNSTFHSLSLFFFLIYSMILQRWINDYSHHVESIGTVLFFWTLVTVCGALLSIQMVKHFFLQKIATNACNIFVHYNIDVNLSQFSSIACMGNLGILFFCSNFIDY